MLNMTELYDIYENDMQMEKLPVNELSTQDIKLLAVFIGKNPKSCVYGEIIGFFEKNNKIYKFQYHVHKPKQRYPQLSNKMTLIKEIAKNKRGYTTEIPTDFGTKAFWDYTPMSYLKKLGDENACILRELMNKITEYSRKHELCKYFRKMDKQAIKENPLYKES